MLHHTMTKTYVCMTRYSESSHWKVIPCYSPWSLWVSFEVPDSMRCSRARYMSSESKRQHLGKKAGTNNRPDQNRPRHKADLMTSSLVRNGANFQITTSILLGVLFQKPAICFRDLLNHGISWGGSNQTRYWPYLFWLTCAVRNKSTYDGGYFEPAFRLIQLEGSANLRISCEIHGRRSRTELTLGTLLLYCKRCLRATVLPPSDTPAFVQN